MISPRLFGLAAFYDLAETEARIITQWQLGDIATDVRYDLFRLLHDNKLRGKYSAIFIDAPPRFSISSIQALCASTHVLVPSILDKSSSTAVGYFGRQLARHAELWPKLRVVGILGTMIEGHKDEAGHLKSAADALRDALRTNSKVPNQLDYLDTLRKPAAIPYELSVPQRVGLARASETGIGYNCLGNNSEGKAVRQVFDALAEELDRRMN